MHTLLPVLIPFCAIGALADFLGPTYPAPRDLTSDDSIVAKSWKNLSSTLEASLSSSQSANSDPLSSLKNLTFSMNMFSVHDPTAPNALQFHHTSAEVANSTTGTSKVDSDSIYRIASVSKLVSVYAGMVEFDSADWDRPITDVVPELLEAGGETSGQINPVYNTDWKKITIGAIAAQIGGVPRDVLPWAADLHFTWLVAQALGDTSTTPDPTTYGFPPLNDSDPIVLPPCAQELLSGSLACDGDLYAKGVQPRAPTFLPWTTPGYANNGFVLLGLALSNLTGKSLDDLYQDTLFRPLGMNSSGSSFSNDMDLSRFVIAGDTALAFATDGGISKSSGGIYSSVNDLAKLGISILNSTLIPSDQTRKWLKPVSHTASLEHSVGRPWEIIRYVHPTSGIVTDVYTKLGDSGDWYSYFVLIPDYDAGFAVAATTTLPSGSLNTAFLTDLITEAMIPALEAQAAKEAQLNFAGTYQSTVEGLNSSLTLFLNESVGSASGLTIASWISNGTDLLPLLPTYFGSSQLRLLPSIPDSGNGQIAFRASAVLDLSSSESAGAFVRQLTVNGDWLTVDSPIYGGLGLSLFVFDVDEDGRATAATPAFLRARLERQS